MLRGLGTQVESKFRLSYRTIISFLSRNIKNIMEFFKESYLENNKIMIMPETIKKIGDLKTELMKLDKISCIYVDNDEYIRKYYQNSFDIKRYRTSLYQLNEISTKLVSGRFVVFYCKQFKREFFALILWYYQEYDQYRVLIAENNQKVIVQYEETKKGESRFTGVFNKKFFRYFEIFKEDIVEVIDHSIKFDQQMLEWDNDQYCFIKKNNFDKVLEEIINFTYRKGPIKLMDYKKVTNGNLDAFELIQKKEKSQIGIKESKCDDCYLRNDHWTMIEKRVKLQKEFEDNKNLVSEENLKYFNEFQHRMTILKILGYIDTEDQILLKGKAAREIATTDCVMIGELLMSNIMEKLDIPETVAFVAGFAFNRNEIELDDIPPISDNFTIAAEEFKKLVEGLVKLEKDHNFEESKYNRRATFGVSKAIYNWIKGAKFREILHDCDLEEGKLFNLIMRMFLFLDEIKSFYETIGNAKIAEKFSEAKKMLIKDILSTKSLYLQEDIDIDAEI